MISPPSRQLEPDTIFRALRGIVGEANCLFGPSDHEAYVTDYRKIYRGRASVVVRPSCTEEVASLMRWCFGNHVPVVPQGGNTSLMGGAVPDHSGTAVVINLARMNKVLEVDPLNATMTVQAGVTLHAARAAAEQSGKLFPLRIGSEGTCQIGGNVSTNAGGTAVLRYGTMRDLVLGVEAVTSNGSVYSCLKGLRKDNTGYDLKQIFIGSEGTLGIVTGVVLKLYPLPTASSVAMVAVKDSLSAVMLLQTAQKMCGESLTAFELISSAALDLVLGYLAGVPCPFADRHAWLVLIELTSTASAEQLASTLMRLLEEGADAGLVLDAAVASNLTQAQTFWKIREEISDAQTRERGSVRCDVSVPISQIARFIADASHAVLGIEPRTRMVVYGHMGDGNVHFNPLRPADMPADEYVNLHGARISSVVDDIVHNYRGSISAEHGIGIAKRDELVHYKSRVELELMWIVKRALDPTNLLNPGKVLPSLDSDRLSAHPKDL